MSIIDSLILGVVQGLTEFIPVSSSGHLIIARDLLNLPLVGSLSFDAVLQLATSLSILVYFRKDWWRMAENLFVKRSGEVNGRGLLTPLIIATVPAVVFGLLLADMMDSVFRSTTVVALALILGSLLMVFAEYLGKHIEHSTGNGEEGIEFTTKKSLMVGIYQTFALIPGMSRSGSTISGGLFAGLSRVEATRFAFLLGFPILFGSGILKLIEIGVSGFSLALLLGAVTAFAVGMGAIHVLLKFLRTHTLYAFVVYRIVLAVLLLLVMR